MLLLLRFTPPGAPTPTTLPAMHETASAILLIAVITTHYLWDQERRRVGPRRPGTSLYARLYLLETAGLHTGAMALLAPAFY